MNSFPARTRLWVRAVSPAGEASKVLRGEGRNPVNEVAGVLLLDKSAGMTSHDVVAAVRRLLRIRQVGHFGTLDPFATGVLPISVGKATRFAQFYLKSRKAYEGTFSFRFATDTFDATGKPTSPTTDPSVDPSRLEKVFAEFTGRISQMPPIFSAKRVGGVRAYALARSGKPVELQPVEVEVYALELLEMMGPEARFAAECSGGTYVRSLAHDVGRRLGLPSHLAGLRRVGVAEFRLQDAVTLDKLSRAVEEDRLDQTLIRLGTLLPGFPELVVRGREEKKIRHGRSFELARAPSLWRPKGSGALLPGTSAAPLLKVFNSERQLIAVARHVGGAVYHPNLVLA